MEPKTQQLYTEILKHELIMALGCTEPIAVAYAAAKAREVLGKMPEKLLAQCSGNIIKNIKGVVVPATGGLRGIAISALIGAVGGDASRELECLTTVTDEHRTLAKKMEAEGVCTVELLEGSSNLDIIITASAGPDTALVEICYAHTNIVRIEKNGQTLFSAKEVHTSSEIDMSVLNLEDIYTYANTASLEDVQPVVERQLRCNLAIAEEGLRNSWGANVGKTLAKYFGDSWPVQAIAYAAAGSDARMAGCELPVVINSGSGNQGITVSLPVYIYAKHLGVDDEQLYRALLLSNLVALYQKSQLGKLSAYCGAVSAATGSGAAITWLSGGDLDAITRTITNTIANVSGIVCDGAKGSCAAKIASSVYSAILGHFMSKDNQSFQPGEGLVMDCLQDTVNAYTRMGRVGMASTDVTILNMMIGKE